MLCTKNSWKNWNFLCSSASVTASENHSPVCYLSFQFSLLSITHSVTYRIQFHRSDRVTLNHLATNMESWLCPQRSSITRCVKAPFGCALLHSCCLAESVNELVSVITGRSFLDTQTAPGLFPRHPLCSGVSGSWGCLKEFGVAAGAPRCATCRSQSRSWSLKKVVARDMRPKIEQDKNVGGCSFGKHLLFF